jgi:hypothetical protein
MILNHSTHRAWLFGAICLLATICSSIAPAAIVSTIDPVGGDKDVTVDMVTSGTRISKADMQSLITSINDLTQAAVFNADSFNNGTGAPDNSSARDFSSEGTAYDNLVFNMSGITRYARSDAVGTSSVNGIYVSGTQTITLTPDSGYRISHFGMTHIATASALDTITVTVNFSGGGNDVFNAAGSAGAPAYWLGFVAPAGQSITSVVIVDSAGGAFANFDDVAVIATATIPEPSSIGLSAMLLIFGGISTFRLRQQQA